MEIEELMALTRTAGGDDPFDALRAAVELRREVERLEAVNVRRARMLGASWNEIAVFLGVSKQAVHKKYGGRKNG
ncbi:hypothetical protein [Allonocardiopsis opalescens]|uniref:Homeodomain-like domain-containing protein n=1 Tax=Allonocardiopsis opalescens TaxID=1144618 RepID=A0A2T0PU66_9ACTN|nr:hypothetical protein [Allonocardiopsis opalescens]PRX92266.1 hypothetical protein CLV72_11026 [Allonocardiopsis opalescens]